MNNRDLTGQKVVVTGASSGIGRAVALACAEVGAAVLLIGRDETRLRQTIADFPDPACGEFCILDLADPEAAAGQLKSALERFTPIAGFVHCAGIASSVPLRALEPDLMAAEYRLNVVSAITLAQVFSHKKHIPPDGASYVFLSSVAAHCGTAGKSSYSATKGALISAARALAAELSPKRIRVNTVSPGYVEGTGITARDFESLPEASRMEIRRQHPLGLGSVKDVAGPVLFLLSDAARWITGTDLVVDGGFTFLKE